MLRQYGHPVERDGVRTNNSSSDGKHCATLSSCDSSRSESPREDVNDSTEISHRYGMSDIRAAFARSHSCGNREVDKVSNQFVDNVPHFFVRELPETTYKSRKATGERRALQAKPQTVYTHVPQRHRVESNVNKRNHKGETKLHVASARGDLAGITDLLKQGASVDVTCNAGWTPLHEACLNGHYSIVQMLTKYSADVNARGPGSVLPIHEAVEYGDPKLVALLVRQGSDISLRNDEGELPADLAGGVPELLEALGSGRTQRRAAAQASLINAMSSGL